MARLPIDIMTSSDAVALPTGKSNVDRANPDDFGAGIGRAITGLGEAGSQLAVKIQANEKKVREFNYEQQFARVQEADNTAYAERQRQLAGTADGHWAGAREESRARFDEWVKTLPREQAAEYAARAQRHVAGRSAQAFQDQYKQQDAHIRGVLTEEQRKAGLGVQANPQSYEQYAAAQIALIDRSPLTPPEKETQKAAVRNALAYTAEQARAQQNPTAFIGSNTGDAVEASKTLLRAKEGFRSGTYWDVNAHRLGYGSDTITRADGTVVQVKQGDTVSREDAERDLERRVKAEFMPAAQAGIGKAAWDKMTPAAQAVMVSLTYNYGAGAWDSSLQRVAIAAQSGDPQALAGAVRSLASHNNGVNASRRNSEANMILSGRASGSPPVASNAALTPEQRASVNEIAQRKFAQEQASTAAAQEAVLTEQRNQVYLGLKEGPNPRATYEEARRTGVIRNFDDVQKAERVLKEREGADEAFNTGVAIMQGGPSAANPFNKEHRNGLDSVYERGVKAGGDPAKTAATIFERTGVVPPQFATAIRGALASDNAGQLAAALSIASQMMKQQPLAFAGVDGRKEIEDAVFEYERHTSLNPSGGEAVKRIMADRRDPARNDPVKQEQLSEFRRQSLTQEKIDSAVKSMFTSYNPFGSAPFSVQLPTGAQRTVMAGDFKALAEEGYTQFRDPAKAMDYARARMDKLYGVQNGVVMKHPPNKSGLPGLPGAADPYAWINEQAAEEIKRTTGRIVPASQIMLVPMAWKEFDTVGAINSQGQMVQRNDSGQAHQRSSFRSVPYQLVVVGANATEETTYVPGAFFPDIETYVAGKNATVKPGFAVDEFGMMYDVPPHAAQEVLQTPEQKARRDKAAVDQRLRDAQAAERAKNERVAGAREQLRNLPPPGELERVYARRKREMEGE